MPTDNLATSTIGQIPRRVTTEAELVGADFETEVSLPGNVRESAKVGMGVLVQTIGKNLPGPNNRKDLRKAVRCYDPTHPNYIAGNATLTELSTDFLCLFTEAVVEFGPDGYRRTYILLYDPTGPLQVFVDGSFTGTKVSARWFLTDSEQAATAGIGAFSNLTTRYAPGTQTVSEGRIWQTDTELVRSSYADNLIPTPSEEEGNPWHEISRSSATALYEYVGVSLARQLQADEELQPGRLYIIRSDAGPVYVHALTNISLAPVAYQHQPDDTFLVGSYDLATDTFSAGGSGGDSAFTITPTENSGDIVAGQTYTLNSQGYITKMLVKYRLPGFASFTIQDAGSQTVEAGTSFAAGFKSFKWSISNADNLADNATITIVDETSNTTLIANTLNDGVQSLSTVAFSAVNGLSRRYRISTLNDKGATLSGVVEIYGSYRLFYGPTSSPSTTSAQARGLLDSRLLSVGNQFVLDSGITQRFFEVDVPPGKTIVSVVDLDNLNQVITGDYVASPLSVNDIGGTARAYTRYVKTQAVPYTNNHRHQITLS